MRNVRREAAAAIVVLTAAAGVTGLAAACGAAPPVGAAFATRAAGQRPPSAAPSVVLVSQPPSTVCAGHRFRVGVWYQRISGGSRAYRIAISGPRHRRFFYRHGRAPSARWRFWKVLAGRAGRYLTTYFGHRPGSSKWTAYRAVTTARRC